MAVKTDRNEERCIVIDFGFKPARAYEGAGSRGAGHGEGARPVVFQGREIALPVRGRAVSSVDGQPD